MRPKKYATETERRQARLDSQKRWYAKDPTKRVARVKAYWSTPEGKRKRLSHLLKRRYNITLVQYEEMLATQNGVCAICDRPPKTRRLHVDHDHKTGKIRSLLCFHCNSFLVAKNTARTALMVMEYLTYHGS